MSMSKVITAITDDRRLKVTLSGIIICAIALLGILIYAGFKFI